MKLSTRSTYGMRALVELALGASRSPVSASLIAKRHDLSVAYLEQLLHRLKNERVIRSVRGPRGGYVLAKEPRRITMGAVVRVLDGERDSGVSRGRNGHRRNGTTGEVRGLSRGESQDTHRHAQQIVHAVRRCVHERLAQSLDAVTLQDLCDEVRSMAGEPLDHRYVFHI